MHNAERHPFTAIDATLGEAGLQPYLPITLTYQDRSITVPGLLDIRVLADLTIRQQGQPLDKTKAMAQELSADQSLSVIQICQQPGIIKSTL